MTLLAWQNLLMEPWVVVHMSQWAVEALFDDDLNPMPQTLSKLLIDRGIEDISVDMVFRIITTLRQVTPSFEDAFGMTNVLLSDVATEPDLLLDEAPYHMRSFFSSSRDKGSKG